jgi:hypothetical protein
MGLKADCSPKPNDQGSWQFAQSARSCERHGFKSDPSSETLPAPVVYHRSGLSYVVVDDLNELSLNRDRRHKHRA